MAQTTLLKAWPKPPLSVEPLYDGRIKGSVALIRKSKEAVDIFML
jgi:hypothetical protein